MPIWFLVLGGIIIGIVLVSGISTGIYRLMREKATWLKRSFMGTILLLLVGGGTWFIFESVAQEDDSVNLKLSPADFYQMKQSNIPSFIIEELSPLQDRIFSTQVSFLTSIEERIGEAQMPKYQETLLKIASPTSNTPYIFIITGIIGILSLGLANQLLVRLTSNKDIKIEGIYGGLNGCIGGAFGGGVVGGIPGMFVGSVIGIAVGGIFEVFDTFRNFLLFLRLIRIFIINNLS